MFGASMNDAMNKALFVTFELDLQNEIIKTLLLNGYRHKVISAYLDIPLERVEAIGKSKRTLCSLDIGISNEKFRGAVFKGWLKRREYKKIEKIVTAITPIRSEQERFLKRHGFTEIQIRDTIN